MKGAIATILYLLGSATATGAQPTTAEQAIEHTRRRVMGISPEADAGTNDCRSSDDPEEIVVCGRDRESESQRIGPSDPVAGAPQRLVAGEVPRGSAVLSATACVTYCAPQGQINVLGVANAVRRGIGLLLDPDS